MNISVIIPNYNGEKLLEKNLPKVVEALIKYRDSEIIVTDDNSKDNSVEKAKSILSKSKIKYEVLTNHKNLGFSSNINRGINIAKGEILILLNTDVVPSKGFIDPLLSDFESEESLFGIGMMDKSIENGQSILRGRGIAQWKRGFLVHEKGDVNKDDTFWISGGSSAVRNNILKAIGSFDSLYDPFYWEDIDLSYRARKAGFKIKFNSESIVEHRHEEGAIKKHYKSNRIKTIAYRNMFIFVWKNITDSSLLISHFFWLPYHFTKAFFSADISFFAGFIRAVIMLPRILNNRNMQKKLYKKEDKDLFY